MLPPISHDTRPAAESVLFICWRDGWGDEEEVVSRRKEEVQRERCEGTLLVIYFFNTRLISLPPATCTTDMHTHPPPPFNLFLYTLRSPPHPSLHAAAVTVACCWRPSFFHSTSSASGGLLPSSTDTAAPVAATATSSASLRAWICLTYLRP